MSRERQERLAAMRRELEKQKAQWQKIKEAVARMGDVEIRIPVELLEKIERYAANTAPTVHVNAVRG